MAELVGESLSSDLTDLSQYETQYSEGDTGEVRVYLDRQLTDEALRSIENNIRSQGVVLTGPVTQDVRVLVIPFKKAIAPLAIIAIVVGAVALVGSTILGWQIFKSVKAGVPLWVWGVGGAALLYLILSSKPAKAAGGLAITAGKVYVTKGMLQNPKRKRR